MQDELSKVDTVGDVFNPGEVGGRFLSDPDGNGLATFLVNGMPEAVVVDCVSEVADDVRKLVNTDVRVSCDVALDDEGEIAAIVHVTGVMPLDLSDVVIEGFDANDGYHEFKELVRVPVRLDETGQIFIMEYEPLNINEYAERQDEVRSNVLEGLAWDWNDLVLCDRDSLAPGATREFRDRFVAAIST